MGPNPYVPGVYGGDGFRPEDGRVEALDGTWAVVADYHSYPICVLRRRADGGVELLRGGAVVDAVALYVGAAPVVRYPGVSRWSRRGRKRWLVVAAPTAYPNHVGIVAAGEQRLTNRARTELRGPAAALLAGARGSAKPVSEQLAECGYRSLVRSADGLFEILHDPDSPGLPLVGRGREQCQFLEPASELWVWDPVKGGRPIEPFRGTVDELRLFHDTPKSAETGYPTPHFHLDDGPDVAEALMVLPRATAR
ncbi:hypothetical protein [Paractinoplanes ferrugineus]|uniref:hypothetical protein n=1 Tax=Paractinoplanes ferrugineus TaxID=113564 RepID=UPI00194068A1|nr:hypothetical protein [Actinoplanes ferrugineus]